LAESLFVLESFCEHPRSDIASVLGRLISSPGVEISGAAIHVDALDRYRRTKIHFVDFLIAATAAAENTPVASFDQDFRKFADVRVETVRLQNQQDTTRLRNIVKWIN
jgi:predicted nucleic-acid-binding protein